MLPFVSILIPIRNEAQYIDRCLHGVLNQTYPDELMEILIADGMSTDRTRRIILDYMIDDSRIKMIDNPEGIVPTGLNRLINVTKGSILIRVDGHCFIDPDYVSNCVSYLQDSQVDGVGGMMRSVGEDRVSKTIALAMSSRFGVGGSFRTETEDTRHSDTVPFPAYRWETIERVGLYDEELVRNQDDEYNFRIRNNGGKIVLASDIKSTYFGRGSLKKLWRQYYQYGYWKVRLLQKHPRQMSLRHFVPFTYILSLLGAVLLAMIWRLAWPLPPFLILIYIFANLAATMSLSFKKGWEHFTLLPTCFVLIHFGYGIGFLVGLIRFSARWQDRSGKIPMLNPGWPIQANS
ncbi:glycosyltransferase family 2 protein [bacterium]|nr:glycosyltransferase family 2 protein [bacterium]